MRRKLTDKELHIVQNIILGILAILSIAIMLFLIMVLDVYSAPALIEVSAADVADIVPVREQFKKDADRIYQEWLSEQVEEVPEEQNTYLIEVTDEEIDLMARVVMSECSIYLSSPIGTDVAQAIAQTIVNRVRDGGWGSTVTEVINYPNAYSTADNGEPTGACYQAVYAALTYEAFDKEMFYFREGKYHSFGTEYTKIGNTYFSCR